MLLSLKDANSVTRKAYQYVMVNFIAVCRIFFLWQIPTDGTVGRQYIIGFGAIPFVLFGERRLSPELAMIHAQLILISSMFMHGGWKHLVGNMLFLWVLATMWKTPWFTGILLFFI